MTNHKNIIIANAYDFDQYLMSKIPVDQLFVDTGYQRVVTHTVNSLVLHWNSEKCDPLLVNYREDEERFYVIDGSHRLTAAKRLSLPWLPCRILVGKTPKEEAKIFADQNRDVSMLKPFDRFHSELFAKDPMAVKTQALFDKYDVKVLRQPRAVVGAIRCLEYCWRLVRDSRADELEFVLRVIKEAGWHYRDKSYNKATVMSLQAIYTAFKDRKEIEDVVVDILKDTTYDKWCAEAKKNRSALTRYNAMKAFMEDQIREAYATREKSNVFPTETLALMRAAQ